MGLMHVFCVQDACWAGWFLTGAADLLGQKLS